MPLELPLFLLGALVLSDAQADVPARAEVRSITSELVCTCGCGNMIVVNCNCTDADRVRGEVAGMLDSGLTREAILQRFAQQYGLEVLASPPRRGFGLSAWVLPFIALASGLWLLVARLRLWASSPRPAPRPAPGPYSEMLDREIREL